MRKAIGILLFLLLLGAAALLIWNNMTKQGRINMPASVSDAFSHVVPASSCNTVKLLTGSAKFAYLQDERVVAALRQRGLCLTLVKTGAVAQDLAQAQDFDAVWPAGANAAQDFAQALGGQAQVGQYLVFSTPLAIASWTTLLPVLQANGLSGTEKGVTTLQLASLLQAMQAGKRWSDLQKNDVFSVQKGILVNTPDIRKSNTGLLYLAAMAWLSNQNQVPTSQEQAQILGHQLAPLFTRQGFQEGTLSGPFEDYLGQGMGKAPLVLVYESQFFEAKRQNKLRDKHMLLYPKPGLVLKHVLVAKTALGKQLGEALAQDPNLQQIAAEYGFRSNNPALLEAALKPLGLTAPELIDLAEIPSSSVLDTLQKTVESELSSQ